MSKFETDMQVLRDIPEGVFDATNKVCDELRAVLFVPEVNMQELLKIWQNNLDDLKEIQPHDLCFNRVVSMKDFFKELIRKGEVEKYRKARLKCRVDLVFKKVWRFYEDMDKVFNCDQAEAAIKAMKKKYEIDFSKEGYQLIEIDETGREISLGMFKDLASAEKELEEYLKVEFKREGAR
jgi:hypothetical protein